MKQWSTAIVPPRNRSTSFYFPFVSGRRPRTVDSYLSSNRQSPGNKSLVFSFMCEWERGVNAGCIFSERLVILANEHAAHRGGVQDLEPMCFACTKTGLTNSFWSIDACFCGKAMILCSHWNPMWPSLQCQIRSSFWAAIRFWFVSPAMELNTSFHVENRLAVTLTEWRAQQLTSIINPMSGRNLEKIVKGSKGNLLV